MAIPKDFLWDTIENLTSEVERLDPNSIIAARTRGLLMARDMSPMTGDRHPRQAKAERADRVAALYMSGKSLEDVAAEIGCCVGTVRNALQSRGIERRQGGARQKTTYDRRDHERIERIKALRAEGKTLQEIGDLEHITRERVRQLCKKAGLDTSKPELSPDQRKAVEEYVGGASLIEVAERHNVGSWRLKRWIVESGHKVRPSRRIKKATYEKAVRASRLYAEGLTTEQMGRELGCAPENIYRLLAIVGVAPNRKRTLRSQELQPA